MNWREKYLMMDMQLHMLQVRCRFRILNKEENLHPGQMGILIMLAQKGRCNQKSLARELHCSAATIAVSVKRMEKSGYVTKESDASDLRSTQVLLTERGKELAQRSMECADRISEIQLQGFSEEEMRQLVGFQNRIKENMETYLGRDKGEQNL